MGVRGSGSKSMRRARSTLENTGFPDPVSSTVAPYLPFDLPTSRRPLAGRLCRHSWSLIDAALCHECPHNAGHLIGESDRHKHGWLTGKHAPEPRTFWGATPASLQHHGACTDDEQAAQCPLSHLRCLAELLPASGGALQRGQSQPGSEVAASLEASRFWGQGNQSRRGDRTDAGNCYQPSCVFVFPGTPSDFDIQFLDPLVERLQSINQNGESHACGLRQLAPGIL